MSKKLMFLKRKDILAIEEYISNLRKYFGDNLQKILLFGSKVTGKDTPESDIDIFILARYVDNSLKDKIVDLAFDINLKRGVYISPRVLPASLFSNRLWNTTPFIQRVKKEGVPL